MAGRLRPGVGQRAAASQYTQVWAHSCYPLLLGPRCIPAGPQAGRDGQAPSRQDGEPSQQPFPSRTCSPVGLLSSIPTVVPTGVSQQLPSWSPGAEQCARVASGLPSFPSLVTTAPNSFRKLPLPQAMPFT